MITFNNGTNPLHDRIIATRLNSYCSGYTPLRLYRRLVSKSYYVTYQPLSLASPVAFAHADQQADSCPRPMPFAAIRGKAPHIRSKNMYLEEVKNIVGDVL